MILGIAFSSGVLLAQTPMFKIVIRGSDTAGRKDSIWFGVHPNATGCSDNSPLLSFNSPCDTVRELEAPPVPPKGNLDMRWGIDGVDDPCIHGGVKVLIHPSFNTTQSDTFPLLLQPSVGSTFILSWEPNLSSFCSSLTLVDTVFFLVNVNMLTQSSVTITNGAVLKTLNVFMKGPKVVKNFPAVPSLVSPTNGMTNVDTNAVFTWAKSDSSKYYHIQVANDTSFKGSTIVYQADTTGTTVSIPLLPVAKYFWRVRGMNAFFRSCYATTNSFSTIVPPPAKPVLLSPANGTLNAGLGTPLTWNMAKFATSFEVVLSTDKFATVLKDTIMVDTTIHFPLQNCVTYYWKVRSINPAFTSAYADSFNFTVIAVLPPVPALLSPAANATGIDAQPTLSWTGDFCAQTYRLQVTLAADTPAYAHPFYDQTISQTSVQLPSLIGQTDYYWRVRSTGSKGSSAYSPIRKFTTKVLPPTSPNLLSPANGSTTADVNPTLTWSKSFNQPDTYRLQVDTSANFSTIIFEDSTLTDTTKLLGPLLNCTQYYWRVRGKNSIGNGQFSATGNFFTPTLAPQIPSLAAPTDGQTVNDPQPVLSWTSGDICSKRFVVWVAFDTGFTQILRKDTIWLTSEKIGPLGGETDYYWKVASLNRTGTASAFTAFRKFTTGIFAPSIPVLVSPAAGFTLTGDTATFVWNTSTNKPRSYHVQISLVNTFATIYLDYPSITDTSVTIDTIKHCDQYYWRVSAQNSAATTAYSPVRNFNTRRAVPLGPWLIYPPSGKDSVSFFPQFQWLPADSCLQSYILVLTDSATNTTIIRDTLTATSFQVSGVPLRPAATYYWEVVAHNEIGDGASVINKFKTTSNTPPDMPVLVFPPNHDANVLLNPVMQWDSAARADTYRLQGALDSNFATRVFDDSTITTNSKEVGPLPNSMTFYWHVLAKNSKGKSAYTPTWSFTTLAPPPAPALIAPPNDSSFISLRPLFQWGIPDGAVYYQIQVAYDSSFTLLIINDSSLQISSYNSPVTLKGRTTHYWHVRGINQAGHGTWSNAFKFKTTPDSPGNYWMPLSVAETGPQRDTVRFGVNARATYGIDPSLNEFELPPPQFGEFDARFIDLESRPGLLGEGVRVNIYPFHNYQQVDTFRIQFQPGFGTYPMKISWPKNRLRFVTDSTVIKDELTGSYVNARMDLVDSVVVTRSFITTLLIITYSAYPDTNSLGVGSPLRNWTGNIPAGYQLYQNYPNPFNPTTTVSFSTEHAADVQLSVYDVLGREIAVLTHGSFGPGLYQIRWDGKNGQGAQMPSGVYYARIIMTGAGTNNERYISTRKMLMLR
ncbi:MAG: FlgD immunoglobulin-like domain containing protein [Bacteroidota bacterium]